MPAPPVAGPCLSLTALSLCTCCRAGLLLAIHDEVLASVSQRLPPEVQVLNAALQETSRYVPEGSAGRWRCWFWSSRRRVMKGKGVGVGRGRGRDSRGVEKRMADRGAATTAKSVELDAQGGATTAKCGTEGERKLHGGGGVVGRPHTGLLDPPLARVLLLHRSPVLLRHPSN